MKHLIDEWSSNFFITANLIGPMNIFENNFLLLMLCWLTSVTCADLLNAQCTNTGTLTSVSSSGPGTEMTRMINRLGLGADCSRCQALAAEMDQRGPAWVEQNFAYVVGRTVSNAEALGHRMGPIRRSGVRLIVRRSVRKSR